MDCVELQHSLAELDDASHPEQQAHLRTCTACSLLVQELQLIVTSAAELQGVDDPSPRVWNSIEIALRKEGLIRKPRAEHPFLPSFAARWGPARWLVPAAAVILVAVGFYVHRQNESLTSTQAALTLPAANLADLNDEDLIQEVEQSSPAMRPQYEENLRRVNQSIREAQGFVDQSPNDADARRSLMDAYQQKAMLFEMAMDRSLP
ncbi:MAG TPA: anti-sigma factor [Candidatus Binatia bacterium]|nr:anti-sigma factor [Candidatus Binatia bacterium]